MQTRSFAATSIRRASYSANALCKASCLAFWAIPCAFSSRSFCMSALLLRDVSSCRMGSISSGSSPTSLVSCWMRSCTDFSVDFVASTAASTTAAFCFRSSTFSCPASFARSSASTSALWTLGSSSPSSFMSSALVFESTLRRSATRAWRLAASSFSLASLSSRTLRCSRPRSSSRAMPTAVLSSWKSPKARPLRLPWHSCLQMRSRFSAGRSKPNSSLE
mmetsp:Transcript_25723/g.81183  ORF Transcript_25723/g.81183 Transcript_25723/m.81183 type:complete len:220 (-) Transcript_25723:452-1111(-)